MKKHAFQSPLEGVSFSYTQRRYKLMAMLKDLAQTVQAAIGAPESEETEQLDAPPTETQTRRKRGGWSLRPQPRIGLDLGSDEDLLMVENMTAVRWIIYHNYHRLGMIDVGELLVFHVHKHGSLSVRPYEDTSDAVGYLVLPLTYNVTYVHIYRRQMGKDVAVYDMRAA